jgi:hypothetical protein
VSGGCIVRQFLTARLSQAWQLYRHRDGIRLWAASLAERLCPGSFPEPAREASANLEYARRLRQYAGFAPLPAQAARRLDEMKASGFAPTEFPFLRDYRLGSHLKYLHRLLDWADERGVETVLVDMPVSADLEERLYPEVFATYRAVLAEVERNRGVLVLRADRRSVGLEDRHFADLVHLNAAGARRLTTWLRRQLEREPVSRVSAKRG